VLGQAFSCEAEEKSGLARVLWRPREPGVTPGSDKGENVPRTPMVMPITNKQRDQLNSFKSILNSANQPETSDSFYRRGLIDRATIYD